MNVFDRIINNVAYKFPKGYPDMGSPEDKKMLFEMVNNILEADENPEEEDLKNKLIDLIKSSDIPDETLKKLFKSISGSGSRGELKSYLNQKGYTPESFKTKESSLEYILDKLTDTETKELIDYLKKPKSLEGASDKGNLAQVTGLSDQLVKDLINIEPGLDASGSSIGKAEVFLALVFKDVDNRSGGGDLNFNGKNLEVKGTGGRFGQQGGRGSSTNYLEIIGDKFLDGEELEEFLSEPSNGNINYALKDIYERATKNGYKSEEVISYIQKILDQIYFNQGLASKFFNGPADFQNLEDMKKKILELNAASYASKNNVDSFLMLNSSSGDYVLIDVDKLSEVVNAGYIDTVVKAPTLGYKWDNTNPQIVLR
jgi:hypothetical protein